MANQANIVQNGIAGPVYLVDANGNPINTTSAGDGLTIGVAATGLYAYNGATEDRAKTTAAGDGQFNGILGAGVYLFNGSSEDRQQGKFGIADVSTGGRSTVAVAASLATNTVVKASPGRLARVLVTVTGTASLAIYDNATTNSGTIIGIIPANPTVGAVYDFGLPAANGITVGGSSTNPGVTISFY